MRSFSEYYSWLLGVIDRSGIVRDRSGMAKRPTGKFTGHIFAPTERGFAKPGASPMGLIFVDGAYMRFRENVRIGRRGGVERLAYSYHYQRPDGYYFRYDLRERPFENPIKCIIEPQRHVQVAQPAPRLPTHSTNLTELMDIIKYNFYA